jgi:hypothetical protein
MCPAASLTQAFHENGKDGVRQLMYEEMSKRMQRPLHIYCCDEEGHVVLTPFVYGPEQPGTPVELVRDNADLYRRHACTSPHISARGHACQREREEGRKMRT